MKYRDIREEELKNKVGQVFFGKFDCTEIIRDIDFAVKLSAYKFKSHFMTSFISGKIKQNAYANLYDIREYFQGRNDKGLMNNRSDNETYNDLIGALRTALKTLAQKIEPKVYAYGFLR